MSTRTFTLTVNGAWVDVYASTGLKPGTPLRIQNRSSTSLLVDSTSASAPTDTSSLTANGNYIEKGKLFIVDVGAAKCWVYGVGVIVVNQDWPALGSLDGLWDGREFRSQYRFSALGTSSVTWFKFNSPVDFILKQQRLNALTGDLRVDVYPSAGVTETLAFSTSIPTRGKNITSRRPTPEYVGQVTLSRGGTITGGTIVETYDAFSSIQGSNTAATVTTESDYRMLASGAYYLGLSVINGTGSGVLSLAWEELP